MQTNKKLYALAIVAHPDDESYLIAGTTLVFRSEKKRLGVLCATRGEKGTDRLNRKLTQKQMAEIRTNEFHKATKILRCACTDLLHYPDGRLENLNLEKLAHHIASYIDEYQPEIVITFGREGISGHHDHILIGETTKKAIKNSKWKPKQLWLMQVPRSVIEEFNEHMNKRRVHHNHYRIIKLKGVSDKKLTQIDISKYSKQKMKAIMAHKSQHVPGLILDYFLTHEYFEVINLA